MTDIMVHNCPIMNVKMNSYKNCFKIKEKLKIVTKHLSTGFKTYKTIAFGLMTSNKSFVLRLDIMHIAFKPNQ